MPPNKSLVSAEVERRSKRLNTPRDYLIGRLFDTPLLPQNIVAFNRQSAAALSLGAALRQQHHRYVLITAVRGAGEIGIDTGTYHIAEGQCLLVHPFQTHWYNNLSAPSIHWLFVTFEHENDPRLDALRGAIAAGPTGLEFAKAFLISWQNPAPSVMARLRLSEWLHHLALQPREGEHLGATEISDISHWIAEINRWVFENRDKPVSASQLASELKISTSLLRSRFQAATGKAIGKYVRELKLQHACELLHRTKWRIGDIADQCGYDSLFSFTRAFTKVYRLSPSSYRKMHISTHSN